MKLLVTRSSNLDMSGTLNFSKNSLNGIYGSLHATRPTNLDQPHPLTVFQRFINSTGQPIAVVLLSSSSFSGIIFCTIG